jgi:hypothetical protein
VQRRRHAGHRPPPGAECNFLLSLLVF